MKEKRRRIDRARSAFRKKDIQQVLEAHRKQEIQRAEEHHKGGGSYVGDFVYGAIDGSVTTFAVVSGVAGASLSPSIVLILGFANLFADGSSMAIGNYLSSKANNEFIRQERQREEWEVQHVPEGEREEIRAIYHAKGFRGKMLEHVTNTITADKKVWVDTMMRDELKLIPDGNSPVRKGLVTFAAFVSIGVIPLISYIVSYFAAAAQAVAYPISIGLTGAAFFLIGSAKTKVTGQSWWREGLMTLLVGGVAAVISYGVGFALSGLV
ncbi:VIT1/CCC1 transporter family protein [Candidatus Woesearchaeota archaeon]|nr:VIT1/CCC1 transporter family protein [Candidatus Woesearchaeota archaeon]